ncbi:neurogenic locus notch homolog protein 2-like [Palaemon carinicauda]|uniref:neurogenic locus notch homolog protein 2-like n=1 Tax=Palaemon carinicauda TaxID=392227 RepID=UPI0035B61883
MGLNMKLFGLSFMLLSCIKPMLVSGEIGQDATCAEKGGTCISMASYTCFNEIEALGCKEDEICCTNNFYHVVLDDSHSRIYCRNVKNCKLLGGYCYDYYINDPNCDFVNKNPCRKSRCACCVRCGRQTVSATCRSYSGICSKACPDHRIQTGNCRSGCKCCGCPATDACNNSNGKCIAKSHTCNGQTYDERCTGDECTCCVEDCQTTDECRIANGRCDRSCLDGEEPNFNIPCEGINCVCCVSTPTPCTNTTLCTQEGGYCNYRCPQDYTVNNDLCDSTNCRCCIPPDPCPNIDQCLGVNGECRQQCLDGEEPDTTVICDPAGSVQRCSCCVRRDPPCRNTTQCMEANGFCNYTCPSGYRPDNTLCEQNCACCIPEDPCPNIDQCLGVNGECRQQCLDGEEPDTTVICDPAGSVQRCSCCVKRDPPCRNTTQCMEANGFCNYTCPSGYRPDNTLCEQNCSCCIPEDPCPNIDQCLGVNGECRQQCLDGEEPDTTVICDPAGSVQRCSCCVKRDPPCRNTTQCMEANGFCNSTCPSGYRPDNTLCEQNCACCIPEDPCPTTDPCLRVGKCRPDCLDGEEVDPNILCDPTQNCSCCVIRLNDQPCTNTTQCLAANGFCRDTCPPNYHRDDSLCGENNCTCCIPMDPCPTTDPCLRVGKCRPDCLDGEEVDPNIVCDSTLRCSCCVIRNDQPCTNTTHCLAANGFCRDTCPPNHQRDDNLCEDQNCTCCIPMVDPPCTNTTRCLEANGFCNYTCPAGHRSDYDLCEQNCACCIPEDPCPTTDPCLRVGKCRPDCLDGEEVDPNIVCDSTLRCSCCVIRNDQPCTNTTHCLAANGFCRDTCPPNHQRDDNLCDDQNCTCCIPMVDPPCTNTTRCLEANGFCNYTCPAGHRSDYDLCEQNCACCIPEDPCPTTDPCLRVGKCRPDCLDGEEVDPNIVCDSTLRCSCCVIRNDQPCTNTTHCLAANGFCRDTCPPNHQRDDNLCEDQNCTCCIPMVDPPCTNTTRCLEANGFCNYTCPAGHRSDYDLCEQNCACCIPEDPCPTTDPCLRVGKCRPDCLDGEEVDPNIVCDSTLRCSCCVIRNDQPCTNTTHCLAANGFCRDTCPPNHQRDDNLCEDQNCTCCIPMVDPPCTNTTRCLEANGFCNYTCPAGHRSDYDLCEQNCACCIPEDPCPTTDPCLRVGKCRPDCLDGEEVDPNIVCDSTQRCSCCVIRNDQPCTNTTHCLAANGFCRETCPPNYQRDDNLCENHNQINDQPCTNTTHCLAANGFCRETCPPNYQRDDNLCENDNCTCCIPIDDPPCTNTTECTNVDGFCSSICPTGYQSNYSLCQQNCACCVPEVVAPCENKTECLDVGGYCNHQCRSDEYPAPGLCAENCTCCIPRVMAPCENKTECLDEGGYCNHQCRSDEYSVPGLCDENCTCCIPRVDPPCTNTTRCLEANGFCNYTCHSGYRPDYELCEQNCACCIPEDLGTCSQSDCCRTARGYCDVSCNSEREIGVPSLCPDDNCQCCIEGLTCTQTQSCTYIQSDGTITWTRGVCATQCPPHLKSIPDLCEGPTCTCCAEPIPTSPTECTQLGGYCFSPLNGVACQGTTFGICGQNEYCCIPNISRLQGNN